MFDPGAVPGLPGDVQLNIMVAIRDFSAFNEDDPHNERDFGALDIQGVGKLFWKIDYYNRAMDGGSEDPSDPAQTVRVLTIMLASEY